MKNFRFISSLFMTVVLIVLMSCQSENDVFDIEAEKPLVEKAIHNSIGWANNKHVEL